MSQSNEEEAWRLIMSPEFMETARKIDEQVNKFSPTTKRRFEQKVKDDIVKKRIEQLKKEMEMIQNELNELYARDKLRTESQPSSQN